VMKKLSTLLLCAALLTSCTFRQYEGVATGSTLGGLFGSAIGGLLGGYDGYEKGTVIGMVAGGVAGAVVADKADKKAQERYESSRYNRDYAYGNRDYAYDNDGYYYDNSISYGRSERYDYESMNRWADLDIVNVQYKDRNGNRTLEAGEEVFVTFDIRNRGRQTLYNVAPRIATNNRHISVSPPAIISTLSPGQGVRYKAAVRASRGLKNGEAIFTVTFGNGRDAYTAKTFRIRTRRR
ncbi:MAG: hypothetical protein IJR24_04905, partial [Alloprevotella sp.]|nr:hypothetical protein [Alloprevotella sp.]